MDWDTLKKFMKFEERLARGAVDYLNPIQTLEDAIWAFSNPIERLTGQGRASQQSMQFPFGGRVRSFRDMGVMEPEGMLPRIQREDLVRRQIEDVDDRDWPVSTPVFEQVMRGLGLKGQAKPKVHEAWEKHYNRLNELSRRAAEKRARAKRAKEAKSTGWFDNAEVQAALVADKMKGRAQAPLHLPSRSKWTGGTAEKPFTFKNFREDMPAFDRHDDPFLKKLALKEYIKTPYKPQKHLRRRRGFHGGD